MLESCCSLILHLCQILDRLCPSTTCSWARLNEFHVMPQVWTEWAVEKGILGKKAKCPSITTDSASNFNAAPKRWRFSLAGGSGRQEHEDTRAGLLLHLYKCSLGLQELGLLSLTFCSACTEPRHVSNLHPDRLLVFPLSLFAPLCFSRDGNAKLMLPVAIIANRLLLPWHALRVHRAWK